MIVPVKSWMRAQDLESAPNEKRQEKKVEEVRRAQPQWIIKGHLRLRSSAFSVSWFPTLSDARQHLKPWGKELPFRKEHILRWVAARTNMNRNRRETRFENCRTEEMGDA